ncbi:transcription termination factor Rho, partial [Oryzihumus sp.]|uniref:transcription termination factor Rho n=1 Tax=Oryzihumus sp. TaxID=1968903 RepID=UPI002ED977F4
VDEVDAHERAYVREDQQIRDLRGRAERTAERDDARGEDRSADRGADNRGERQERGDTRGERTDRNNRTDNRDNRGDRAERGNEGRGERQERTDRNDRNDTRGERVDHTERNDRTDRAGEGRTNDGRRSGGNDFDDDERGGRRRGRQRYRDRKRRGGGRENDFQDSPEMVTDEDVLVPVAGILDVLDNYAFVRTSGYLPGPNDVYVPLGMVKKNGLRKGDAVTGAVKALREGEQPGNSRQKFNALVRLDTVNGMTPEQARARVEFGKLTPLYPQERLRLETEPGMLTTRLIDLVAPIGKGQRGLIVSPPKAGKTMVLQAIANAITTNNPEAHLMIVLVDERPEEVTDMQRTVKGEVIASTFDRPAEDHTTVAELAIERAKRLVEMGHDVVVLLDSITRLGRAYNLAAPASGRILSGGVDSSALYPPKRFFGAARNIENGGSLTILATALVETGSKMDEVIFEEFKGTGNMELRLSRQLADRRIFPAVDVNPSGTRREEILMSAEELKIVWKLRRVLSALDSQQGIELLIDRLKKTRSNVEFLMQVQKTSSIQGDDDN